MSSVIVIAPIVVASWPAITAAVAAAIGSLGFTMARAGVGTSAAAVTRAEIEVPESEILQDAAGSGQQIVVEREGIRAILSRDGRGALKVCMEGAGYTKAQLRQVGEELLGAITQQYVYHKIVTELKQRKMAIVDEAVDEDRTVRIRVRNAV
jgi:hypothetical protein